MNDIIGNIEFVDSKSKEAVKSTESFANMAVYSIIGKELKDDKCPGSAYNQSSQNTELDTIHNKLNTLILSGSQSNNLFKVNEQIRMLSSATNIEYNGLQKANYLYN